MQKAVGWTLMVAGLVAAVVGIVVMALLGPDGRFTTGPHAIDTDGVAVVTAPGAIAWRGVQVDVLAQVPGNKPIFVGVGHSVDVEDYVGQTQRLVVTEFSTPWDPTFREVEGRPALDAAPTAMDWWLTGQAGLGGADISMELPDETVSLAVLSVGSTNLSGLEVTFAYGVKGGFGRGLGLALVGLGTIWAGWAVAAGRLWRPLPVLRTERWTDTDEIVIEEEVFVWVDDDGVEHELTAEEIASWEDYEVVDEADLSPPDFHHDPEPEPTNPTVAEVLAARPAAPPTAGQIAAEAGQFEQTGGHIDGHIDGRTHGQDAPTDEQDDPSGKRQPAPGPDGVVFVWVDEDGVEHEVSPDELDGYEIVDEEDPS